MDIIVTRHLALVQYLIEESIVDKDNYKLMPHATEDDVTDNHAFGVLPHSLSCLTASYTEVPLTIPQELRGKELTIEQIREYATEPKTYFVKHLRRQWK